MNIMIDLLSWVSLVAGSIFLIIGTIGLIRLPDFLHGYMQPVLLIRLDVF